jgi:hypothetical protein
MQHSKPKSIISYQKYGIARSTLIHSLTYKKYIPLQEQIALSSYKLLIWTKELLDLKLNGHKVTRFNKQYIVIWVYPDTRDSYLSSPLESEFFLSFREPQEEYDLQNYVLIWRSY